MLNNSSGFISWFIVGATDLECALGIALKKIDTSITNHWLPKTYA